jgi:hypothetical protein
MTEAQLEPFFGLPVVVTVAIKNLEAEEYVGLVHPYSRNATPKHWVTPPGSAKSEPRVVLDPLPSVPDMYKATATNGLALCPVSAVTAIARIEN